MKKDPVEALYKGAFDEIKPVEHGAILEKVHSRMYGKPTRFKRKTFAAVMAACLLLFSTVAVAAAQAIYRSRSGLDRLAEVIGEESVSRLQPISLSDFGIDDTYRVAYITTEDGIRVELIAVGAGDSYMDVYLLLEDLNGNRFVDEWFNVSHYIRFTDPVLSTYEKGGGGMLQLNVIARDEAAGAVLIHSRLRRPFLPPYANIGDANVRNLTINILSIVHNLRFIDGSGAATREIIELNWPVSFELQGGADLPEPPPEPEGTPLDFDALVALHDALMADPVIADLMGGRMGGHAIGVERWVGEDIPRIFFTDVHGNTTHQEDFDSLPPLLVEYILHTAWELDGLSK